MEDGGNPDATDLRPVEKYRIVALGVAAGLSVTSVVTGFTSILAIALGLTVGTVIMALARP